MLTVNKTGERSMFWKQQRDMFVFQLVTLRWVHCTFAQLAVTRDSAYKTLIVTINSTNTNGYLEITNMKISGIMR